MTTWLDLQNAYGSVPHNLIQFALEWYHVPENIRRMIFKYYDESYIRVKTKEWTTDWIHCGIDVFQGCPLSCILFLAVFNLCLNILDEYSQLGYCMSNSTIKSKQEVQVRGEIATIHSQPMRFLGKLIFEDLKDQAIRQSVKGKLKDMLKATEESQLNGIIKMWMYNTAIIPKMTWEFTI